MKKNESLSSNQLQILSISKAIYQNEFFYKTCLKDNEYYGYLTDNKFIDKIKKKINYEKIKPLVAKDETYDKYKNEIKETQDKIEEIIPKEYKNSKGLMQELLNYNKSFYLIKQEYLSKIIDNTKLTGKEIKFKFHGDNIILIFGENDLLVFTNNKDGILEKKILQNNFITTSEGNGDNSKLNRDTPNDHIKFKTDLEILVRIFYFNKYLKEKETDEFKKLTKENNETIYLINNLWMEEYKSFFDFQILEDYLINKKEYSDSFVSEKVINKLVESLPIDYINKIN